MTDLQAKDVALARLNTGVACVACDGTGSIIEVMSEGQCLSSRCQVCDGHGITARYVLVTDDMEIVSI